MSLEDYGISTGVLPSGGGGQWRYDQDGLEEPLYGSSPEELVKKIMQHRINRGIAVGNCEEDLAEFIRKTSPQNDRFRRQAHQLVMPATRKIVPLAERIKEWLVSKQNGVAKLTDAFESQRRAELCANCPQNIPWQTSCGECNSDVRYRGDIVRQKTQGVNDKKLRACRKSNLYLPTAVELDIDELPKKEADFPSQCWLSEA